MAKVENKVTEKVTNKKEENLENTSLVKLDDFKSVDEMMKFAKHLIDSKLLPIAVNTPEKVVTMIQLGKELGVGSVSALTNIHVIDGRPTLGVHLIGALIRKAGIKYSLIEDFKSITDKDGKSTGNRKTTIRFYEKWNGKVIETDFSFTTSLLSKILNTLSLAIIPICNTLNLSAIILKGRNKRFRHKMNDVMIPPIFADSSGVSESD